MNKTLKDLWKYNKNEKKTKKTHFVPGSKISWPDDLLLGDLGDQIWLLGYLVEIPQW
jgi:hypothetical protein